MLRLCLTDSMIVLENLPPYPPTIPCRINTWPSRFLVQQLRTQFLITYFLDSNIGTVQVVVLMMALSRCSVEYQRSGAWGDWVVHRLTYPVNLNLACVAPVVR